MYQCTIFIWYTSNSLSTKKKHKNCICINILYGKWKFQLFFCCNQDITSVVVLIDFHWLQFIFTFNLRMCNADIAGFKQIGYKK